MIARNLKSVTERIAKSCEKVGRSPQDVELVAITKEASVSQIEEVLGLGVRTLGENRVQDALAKHRIIGDRAQWHLIGHLQTNKAKDAVGIFSLVHSVDSLRLAAAIDKEAKKINKIQDVLIQVNTSAEATKFGMPPEAALDFLKEAALYRNINIKGLMTIAPEVDDPQEARPYFRKLKQLLDEINERRTTPVRRSLGDGGIDERRVLSMGLTNDFEVAIEEGSTMVRIGRAIFG